MDRFRKVQDSAGRELQRGADCMDLLYCFAPRWRVAHCHEYAVGQNGNHDKHVETFDPTLRKKHNQSKFSDCGVCRQRVEGYECMRIRMAALRRRLKALRV